LISGQVKSLMSLWSQLAEESASLCCTSATRDIKTVSSRVEHEGLSFLTITLPELGKATRKWLDQGQAGIHPSFHQERGGSLPVFMKGFFYRVFDRYSGALLDDPCIDSISSILQLTLGFGKMEVDCSLERKASAIQKYIECEQDVRQFDTKFTESDLREFGEMSNLLFSTLFTKVDREIYYGTAIPKHGPGSTADGLAGNGKFRQTDWTSRLEKIFPCGENLIPNFRYFTELEQVDILEPGSEVPVKVTLVPKTLKTPRVIAMEPTCMQYMQQAVLSSYLGHFYRDRLLRKLIGFDDQEPNRRLAHSGSIDNRTATLDLSDASDRVSNQLVRTMFAQWPHLREAIDATRSRRAALPSGNGTPTQVLRLAKFASMGSALCFPVEAMVFTTLIFVGIQRSLNVTLTRKDVLRLSGTVRVYGDDLIVPTDHVLSVVQALEHFGAQVGLDKSFWTGKFRESCGREYFNGHDVTPTRVRQMFPARQQDSIEVISLVSLRNQLYMSGYWRTCQWLDERIRKVLRIFPNVMPTSPILGRVCSLGYAEWQPQRYHPDLQIPLVRGFVVQAKAPRDPLGDTGALLKCLLRLEQRALRVETPWLSPDQSGISLVMRENPWLSRGLATPALTDEHLERSGRPQRVDTKLRWSRPY
jgi:hypothetical protein